MLEDIEADILKKEAEKQIKATEKAELTKNQQVVKRRRSIEDRKLARELGLELGDLV